VLRELMPLFMALLVSAAVYVARERRRRRMRIAPSRPDIAMRDVWDAPALLEIERLCLAAEDPRVALRRAAIENLVAALYLEAVAECGAVSDEGMLRFHMQVSSALRQYLRLKYDDAAPDDWFDHFSGIARPYIRERVRLTREFTLYLDEGAERFARIYDELLQSLVKQALSAPQKKTFVPPDFSQS
jgi:hypothetical protein